MNLNELHHFWFGDIKVDEAYYAKNVSLWFFGKDPSFDLLCKERFSPWLTSELRLLAEDKTYLQTLSSREFLALIILMDQIPRNSFRGTKDCYAYDALAQKLCLFGLGSFLEQELTHPEKLFFYMPLEHAESLDLQEKNVELFERLHNEASSSIKSWTQLSLDKAREHRQTIIQHGRFPHRKLL